jgi:hypothetical protein
MYLSSYLSRSAFLPSEYIGGQVRGLIKWASEYVDRKGDSPPTVEYDEFGRACVRPQIGAHELFYCVVQSACYVLCFHGVKMALEQREIRAYWENTVSSIYDPLRVCLRSGEYMYLTPSFHGVCEYMYLTPPFNPLLLLYTY